MVRLVMLLGSALSLLFVCMVIILSVQEYHASPIDQLLLSPLHVSGYSPYDWWGPCMTGVYLYTQKDCPRSDHVKALLKESSVWFQEKDIAQYQPSRIRWNNKPGTIRL